MYGACTSDPEHVCLIMELMEGGNLYQRIYDRCKRRMSYLEILQVRRAAGSGACACGGDGGHACVRGGWWVVLLCVCVCRFGAGECLAAEGATACAPR